jgi:hypothetical protein
MIVDLLRRPYKQKVRFFSDLNREDTIRWYQCRKGAQFLPFPTVFSSAVWDDENPPTPPENWVGELKLPPVYTTWYYPYAGPGLNYHGTAEQFQNGFTLADLEVATPAQCCAPRGTPARTWCTVKTAWPTPPNTAWEWSKVGADVRYQPTPTAAAEYSAINSIVDFLDISSYVSNLGEFSQVTTVIDGPIWWLKPEQMASYSVGGQVATWPSFSLPTDPATQSDPTMQPGVGPPTAPLGLQFAGFFRGAELDATTPIVCDQGFSVYLVWYPPVVAILPVIFSPDGPGLLWSGGSAGFSIHVNKTQIVVQTNLWTQNQLWTQNLSYDQLIAIRYNSQAGSLKISSQGTTIAVHTLAPGAILTVTGLAVFPGPGGLGGVNWAETIVYSYCLTDAQDADVYVTLQSRYTLP